MRRKAGKARKTGKVLPSPAPVVSPYLLPKDRKWLAALLNAQTMRRKAGKTRKTGKARLPAPVVSLYLLPEDRKRLAALCKARNRSASYLFREWLRNSIDPIPRTKEGVR
jgi:hypothetical protein